MTISGHGKHKVYEKQDLRMIPLKSVWSWWAVNQQKILHLISIKSSTARQHKRSRWDRLQTCV